MLVIRITSNGILNNFCLERWINVLRLYNYEIAWKVIALVKQNSPINFMLQTSLFFLLNKPNFLVGHQYKKSTLHFFLLFIHAFYNKSNLLRSHFFVKYSLKKNHIVQMIKQCGNSTYTSRTFQILHKIWEWELLDQLKINSKRLKGK